MRVFIYEFVTGGGCSGREEPPAESLLAEGRAMARLLAQDFAVIDGVRVFTTRDVRQPPFHPPQCDISLVASRADERAAIERLARAANWTLLIAPETNGALLERSRLVESVGGRLLCPSPARVKLASSKQLTADWLAQHGVRVPRGVRICDARDLSTAELRYPVVIKSDDGCGSQSMTLMSTPNDDLPFAIHHSPMRVEEFVPGLPASVAVLCGPAGNYALPACEQRLSTDGRFQYLGGRLPLKAPLNARARQIALAAVAALPKTQGYVGIDLVLGEAPDGSRDDVIEINPRLTTSYVGLRALARTNLAAAMLAVARGQSPDLSFGNEPLEFSADGIVSHLTCSPTPAL